MVAETRQFPSTGHFADVSQTTLRDSRAVLHKPALRFVVELEDEQERPIVCKTASNLHTWTEATAEGFRPYYLGRHSPQCRKKAIFVLKKHRIIQGESLGSVWKHLFSLPRAEYTHCAHPEYTEGSAATHTCTTILWKLPARKHAPSKRFSRSSACTHANVSYPFRLSGERRTRSRACLGTRQQVPGCVEKSPLFQS